MIHKIEKIVSIGRFRNYRASGDVAFRKLTLIYADNGGGKTTLSAILRSLTLNAPLIINKRKSTNATEPQLAQIIQRDNNGNDLSHNFNSRGWSSTFPNIEIFDIHFVHENVYSGFDFNDDHRKQLHQFLIGAQAVSAQEQINQNKAAKTSSRQKQDDFKEQLVQKVANGLTKHQVSDFIKTPTNQDIKIINQQIKLAEQALKNAKSNPIINTLQILTKIDNINLTIDFPATTKDLLITIDNIQDSATQRIYKDHHTDLESNKMKNPETWLKNGFDYFVSKEKEQPTDLAPV